MQGGSVTPVMNFWHHALTVLGVHGIFNYGITTTTTTVLRPFVRDYPGESVPEGKTILDFAEADMMGWQWHQLNHMQAICTSLQKITTPAPQQSDFYGPDALPNQQRQSTEYPQKTCTNSLTFMGHPVQTTLLYSLKSFHCFIEHM